MKAGGTVVPSMGLHSDARSRRQRRGTATGPLGDEEHSLGEEALDFTKWFTQSKYRLMAGFLGELARDPGERDLDVLKERYTRTLTHAQRVLTARGLVTFLLVVGVVAAAASAIANLLAVPTILEGDVAATTGFLQRLAAYSTSASVVFVALRLLLDRYLERIDVTATFLAIEIATAART